MGYNVEVIETKLFAAVVADEIVASVNDSLHDHGRCSLVLAGGKTPSVIYRTLAKPPRVGEIDWQKVLIYWGDERWVPKTDMQSNFKMVSETLLSFLPQPGPQVYPVDTSAPTPQNGAASYSALIAKTLNLQPGQAPIFDVVLLGMGEDGHTASIFPHSELLQQQSHPAEARICAAVPGPGGEGYRITMVPEVLFSAQRVLFIVRGDNKAAIIKRALEGAEGPLDLPARLFVESKAKVSWFVDSSAAQQLSRCY